MMLGWNWETPNISHNTLFGELYKNVMKRQFSNNFCNHCWNFSVDILWCHFMGLLQINAAQLLPYIYKKKNSFLFFVGDKISSYNQTPALWLVTITSQTDVWTLTNEWFSEGSFCFIGGGALEIWRNLSACLLSSGPDISAWSLMTSSILCFSVYRSQILDSPAPGRVGRIAQNHKCNLCFSTKSIFAVWVSKK